MATQVAGSSSPVDNAMHCDQAGPGSSPVDFVESPRERVGSKRKHEGDPAHDKRCYSDPAAQGCPWCNWTGILEHEDGQVCYSCVGASGERVFCDKHGMGCDNLRLGSR